METLITVIHIILCFILMVVILLQSGKGAEIGAVFGGSSQTIFGSQGAATFLSKVTSICAIGFMVTSLSLVYLNAHHASSSIMDESVESQSIVPGDEAGEEAGADAMQPAEDGATKAVEKPAAMADEATEGKSGDAEATPSPTAEPSEKE